MLTSDIGLRLIFGDFGLLYGGLCQVHPWIHVRYLKVACLVYGVVPW